MAPDINERSTFFASAAHPKPTVASDHGLRFTNDEWNGSISNGEPFTVRWNESIDSTEGTLQLYKIQYPEDGVIELEWVSNLTGQGQMDDTSCTWTPADLEDDLYTLWLTTTDEEVEHWAMSPPWSQREDAPRLPWAIPIGVPIVVILCLYFASLITCLIYRRRKRAKLAKAVAEPRRGSDSSEEGYPMPEDADRHPSLSSVVTVQTYTEDEDLVKKDDRWSWMLPTGSVPWSDTRRSRNPSVVEYVGDGLNSRCKGQCAECAGGRQWDWDWDRAREHRNAYASDELQDFQIGQAR